MINRWTGSKKLNAKGVTNLRQVSISRLDYTRLLKREEVPSRVPEIISMEGNVMGTKNILLGRAFLTSLAVLLMTFSVSCSFSGHPGPQISRFCSEFEDLRLTEVSQGPLSTVYENPGTIKVIHGSGTANMISSPMNILSRLSKAWKFRIMLTRQRFFLTVGNRVTSAMTTRMSWGLQP